ncbi:hypothetical protein [Chroococcidiopsis sp. SAG 2025]|nr:hypothetical protein [Chroococcidiopsis sp. SAG 2025]
MKITGTTSIDRHNAIADLNEEHHNGGCIVKTRRLYLRSGSG